MDLWDVMVSIFWFMLLVAWFSLLFSIIADIFHDPEMSGWGKGGWCTFVILAPWLGVFTYLVVRGRSMGERASARRAAYGYPQGGPGQGPAGSTAHELGQLADLRDKGLLTQAEFDKAKARVLGTGMPAGSPAS
jgi:hypothetical protein